MNDTAPVPAASTQSLSFLAGGGEMGALIRSHDWSRTPLGPPDQWPQSLKTSVRIMLTSRQPIWIGWGQELIYLYNDPYQSIVGGKHPWALGKPTRDVWHEIRSEIGPMLDKAMGGQEGTYVEEQLLIMERHGYAEETYYTFSYSPIPDDQGAPGGIICANTDDTQRVIGERQLKLLRQLAAETTEARSWSDACQRSVRALATDSHDVTFALLYVIPPNGDAATLAAASGLSAGHPAAPANIPIASVEPWPIASVLEKHEPQVVDDLARRVGVELPVSRIWNRASTRAAVLSVPPSGETGRTCVLVIGLNPHRLFDDSYRGFLGLAAGQIAAAMANADAYEEERRRVEALAELDRAKTVFFSNVSHEFRTPLTLMLGPLEEMRARTDLALDVRSQVELAHRNGARLLRLVNSLLDFSRIEAGRVQASYQPTDLARFSADIAATFRSAIEKAGLRLNVRCQPLPQPVYIDRDLWEKVLLNLLSNAFKFTFDGEIGISVDVAPGGDAVVTTIRDTGVGIADNEMPKLFERFHRIEGVRGRSYEGSGIGLALVQELVKLHGGTIGAESAIGVGTTFKIVLPFGTAHLPSDRVRELAGDSNTFELARAQGYVEEALRWLPEQTDDTGEFARAELSHVTSLSADTEGAGKLVLLADDNSDMRRYVCNILHSSGYAVEEVPDGEAALKVARRVKPDLILTDVMMPKLDGFGLLRAIRADATLAPVPVIVLSARAGEEAKVEGLDAGADDYLIKPFAARELLARVHSSIQMAEIRQEAAQAVLKSEQLTHMTQERLSLALSTGRVAVFEWTPNTDELTLFGPLAEVFGVAPTDAQAGVPLSSVLNTIHPDDLPRVLEVLQRSVDSGEPYEAEYRVTGTGEERVVIARGRLEKDAGGRQRMTGVVIDVTEEQLATRALRDQTRALTIVNRAAAAISGDLDQERVVQTITDAAVELVGAQFGSFFYNVVDDKGESYTLYTLSGAPREAFARFPMPRNTHVFEPTFSGTAVVRSPDITKDPRYGHSSPHYGMPKGHLPVRSYLAAPVKSRGGEVLGGLFFGHEQVGVFDEVSEERLVGIASQAAIAIDNARLFKESQAELQRRRRVEAELQTLNTGLEKRVQQEVAQRLKAEEALRQAQKMEAVGQLTGGVAHDFNNLLTVIIGGLDTIKRSKSGDEARVTRAADMALQGALRAASLTSRLLAFSRRQPLEPKPLELNVLVRDMTELLHRTLGEQIELEGILAPRLWSVEADQNQLESAIINLAVNARDAMPDGGKLTIETSNTALDETYTATDAEVIPGQYVMLAVSDTGSGMSRDVVARAFEPFFTTKEVGRGTGLGLSMVYGFVKQSGGHVTIYSEQGHGTTVKLYFPRFFGNKAAGAVKKEAAIPRSAEGEVILVVEDNEDVRAYSTAVLSELGYVVLEAPEADAALAILKTTKRVDLLFTDVVLPAKSGRALVDEALSLRPNLRVLYTTGYSRNAIIHQGRLDAGVHLISKPFTFEQLATRVRDLLDR